MARLYDFSKVSVSIHSFTVNPVQIAIAGLIKIELSRENIVLHACDSLIIILIFHVIDLLFKYRFSPLSLSVNGLIPYPLLL
jgi:hypothetical protein